MCGRCHFQYYYISFVGAHYIGVIYDSREASRALSLSYTHKTQININGVCGSGGEDDDGGIDM